MVGSLVAAINSNELLQQQGTSAGSDGSRLIVYGESAETEISDSGLSLAPGPLAVPSLTLPGAILLATALLGLGARRRRPARRSCRALVP